MAYSFLLLNGSPVSGLFDSSDNFIDSTEEVDSSEGGEGSDDLFVVPISANSSVRDGGDVSDLDLYNIESNQEYIIQQIDNLNTNVCTLQADNSITVGLLFSITILLAVQLVFKLLYKFLGLGSC